MLGSQPQVGRFPRQGGQAKAMPLCERCGDAKDGRVGVTIQFKRAQICAETEAGVASIANVWRGLATVHKHVVRECLKAECLLRWQGQCKPMCCVRQALQSIVQALQQTYCM